MSLISGSPGARGFGCSLGFSGDSSGALPAVRMLTKRFSVSNQNGAPSDIAAVVTSHPSSIDESPSTVLQDIQAVPPHQSGSTWRSDLSWHDRQPIGRPSVSICARSESNRVAPVGLATTFTGTDSTAAAVSPRRSETVNDSRLSVLTSLTRARTGTVRCPCVGHTVDRRNVSVTPQPNVRFALCPSIWSTPLPPDAGSVTVAVSVSPCCSSDDDSLTPSEAAVLANSTPRRSTVGDGAFAYD